MDVAGEKPLGQLLGFKLRLVHRPSGTKHAPPGRILGHEIQSPWTAQWPFTVGDVASWQSLLRACDLLPQHGLKS